MPSRAPEEIGGDACDLQRRWLLDARLARNLVSLAAFVEKEFASAGLRGPGLWIISGYRSESEQAQLNPSLPASLHRRCPSLAVDLRLGTTAATVTSPEVWRIIGGKWKLISWGRWGGDFKDQSRFELNHFDLGVGN